MFKALPALAAQGPYDLILAGGLFDYLPDRAARFVAGQAINKLCKPGSLFYFANIGKGNPYRYWAEYLSDWVLIERDEPGIRRLLNGAYALIRAIGSTTTPPGCPSSPTYNAALPDPHAPGLDQAPTRGPKAVAQVVSHSSPGTVTQEGRPPTPHGHGRHRARHPP